MKEGFWSVAYYGESGMGFGVIALETGIMVGADAAGGIWDGEYKYNPNTEQIDLDFSIRLPPEAVSMLTGQTGSQDWLRERHKVSFPNIVDDETECEVRTPFGFPLRVVFKKIRAWPDPD